MANSSKKKKIKKPKNKASVATGTSPCHASSAANNSNSNSHSNKPIWSSATECAYYAALGCHIAAIARCRVKDGHDDNNDRPPARKSKSKRLPRNNHDATANDFTLTCSDYRNMYQNAMEQYPWLLELERFDPCDYHPEDIESIPEIAMNDGYDDDDDDDDEYEDYHEGDDSLTGGQTGDCNGMPTPKHMTLTVTNISKKTNIHFVTVFDVDLCGSDGKILKSGWTYSSTVASEDSHVEQNKKNDTTKITTNLGYEEEDEPNPSTTPPSNTAVAKEESFVPSTITTKRKCTTFIVLCPPQTFVHLCSLAPNQIQPSQCTEEKNTQHPKSLITSWSQVDIESDVQPWSSHANTEDEHSHLLHFPFTGLCTEDAPTSLTTSSAISSSPTSSVGMAEKSTTATKAYQCTQSEHGQLTHFFHGNYHAIDFACPIGTLLYSPADGIVVEVRHDGGGGGDNNNSGYASGGGDSHTNVDGRHEKCKPRIIEVSGIAARNMFHWNSIMIRVTGSSTNDSEDNPLYIEYVHIQTNSCVVQVGDVVRKGQLLCRSGSVGFSPEPHLHLAAYRSNGDDAATVRVGFQCGENIIEGDTDGGNGSVLCSSAASSFLPRAGGWYNECGLVETEAKV